MVEKLIEIFQMAVKIYAEKFTDKWTKVETKYLENRYWDCKLEELNCTLVINFPAEPMQSHITSAQNQIQDKNFI